MKGSVIVLLFASACAAALADAEKAKLDGRLLAVVQGDTIVEGDYTISTRSDGSRQYAVLIHCTDWKALRSAGIEVESVLGGIATARLTKDELRKIVSLPSVRAVENNAKDLPNIR